MQGDDFTIRFEAINRGGMVAMRFWAPGDDFTDAPAFDTDDLEVIVPLTISPGMRVGLALIGVTLRSVAVSAIP